MRIVIIGGGASTVSLLYQLTQKISDDTPLEIFIIEKENEIGTGLAYGTNDRSHILNLPAKLMTPIPETPSHFYDWALQNKNLWENEFPHLDIKTSDYPPRSLYGIYLKNLFKVLIENAKEKKVKITPLTGCEAINVIKENTRKFKVFLSKSDYSYLTCEIVVLSIGHLDSDKYTEFKNNSSYCHSPWLTKSLKKIPLHASIFIAGTRLTAIDTVLSLKSQGHTGEIILGSKLGLLPTVIGKIDFSYTKKFFTYEKILELSAYGTKKIELDTLLSLFKAEIESGSHKKFNLHKILTSSISAYRFLKQEIDDVKKGKSRHWQNVLFSLYPNVSFIWNSLSYKSKKEFLEKYYSIWMTYLAAFPLENAEKILKLIEENKIKIIRNFRKIVYDYTVKKFIISFNENILQCDYFINATGAGHDVKKFSSALIENMIKNKLLKSYDLGGVKVDFKTLQAISDQRIKGLYIMGDSGIYGTCLATADLSQSNKQAERIAISIIKQLKNMQKPKKSILSNKILESSEYSA